MRVTRYTVILNVLRSVGLVLIVTLADGLQNQDKAFFGPKINHWHNWLPDPLKIGRLNPLKRAEIAFHNQSLVNFGPGGDMPEYYTYGYRFYEPKAGEFKDHKEFRNGGLIHGSLSVLQKSGARTNITYLGLPWAGWQAVVETQNDSLRNGTGTTAAPTELSQGTESMRISTMQMRTEESDATTSKQDCSATTSAEASCKVTFEEASSMCTVCSKMLTTEASCEQTYTEIPSAKSAAEATSERAAEASSEGAAEASSKQATTLPMPNSMDSCTNPPTKQSTAPGTFHPSKGAYTKHKLQMSSRHHPSTTPSLRKSHKDVDQVVQTWQKVQPPVQKPAKSSWLFSAQRNPLDLEPFQMQPSEHRKPLFTTHKGMFQRLNQHFSFSSHPLPHRQLSDATTMPMKLSTRRKSYSVHQAGKTESEHRRHRLRPEEPHRRLKIVA